LFLFFTGSDWCGWCIRLQNEVFKTPEFITWAKEKVVLVELDFPRRTPQSDAIKLQNSQMQQMFQVQGYPKIWIVKPTVTDGKTNFEKLGESGYVAGGPAAFLKGTNQMLEKFVADPKPEKPKKVKKKKAKKA
jgi:protein disulfide-isomerase